GTGLGLATVYGIVKQCGGQVFVNSRPNEGSTFEIFLPILGAAVTGEHPIPTRRADLTGSEVVLVVEDEPGVRAPICRSLRKLGYFVIEAENGEDALRKLEDYHAPVHLLVTDVIMPEMNGAELTQLLH